MAVVETLVPAALVFTQGADNLPEFAAFAGTVLLLSAPNVAMLLGEAAGNPGLTRTLRNVGILEMRGFRQVMVPLSPHRLTPDRQA